MKKSMLLVAVLGLSLVPTVGLARVNEGVLCETPDWILAFDQHGIYRSRLVEQFCDVLVVQEVRAYVYDQASTGGIILDVVNKGDRLTVISQYKRLLVVVYGDNPYQKGYVQASSGCLGREAVLTRVPIRMDVLLQF